MARKAKVLITPELIISILTEGKKLPAFKVTKGIPKDSIIISIEKNANIIELILSSNEFKLVEPKDEIPTIPIEFKQIG